MKILLTTKCIIYRGIKMSINCDITINILTISLSGTAATFPEDIS